MSASFAAVTSEMAWLFVITAGEQQLLHPLIEMCSLFWAQSAMSSRLCCR